MKKGELRNRGIPIRWLSEEQGTSLLETVVAVALVSAVVVFFVSALGAHSVSTRSADANDVALNLVKTQMEDIKNATYASNYDSLKLTPPPGYTITLTAEYVDTNLTVSQTDTKLQRIIVTISRSGRTYLSVQMLKANLG